jgi:hypothetical protein
MNHIKLFEQFKEEQQLVVYRGGWTESEVPNFWSTDINVAMCFYNECRYIINGKYTKSIEDIEEILSIVEPYENIDWILGWNIFDAFEKGDKRIPQIKEWIKDNIFINDNIKGKVTQLIITENKNTSLMKGVTNFSNPLILDFKGKVWGETDAVIEFHFPEARKRNCDCVIVNNIIEGGFSKQIGDIPATTFVELKPNVVINKVTVDYSDYPERYYY